jgi:cell wall-associated NlpC family hydrolase
LGQVYKILDESGFNGSIILDDMQMSYSDLNTFKEINIQHIRSPKYEYVKANAEDNCTKPEKTRIDIWKEANKQLYLDAHPEIIINETPNEEVIDDANAESEVEPPKTEQTDPGYIEEDEDLYLSEEELNSNKEEELPEEIIAETNYIFRMNWAETFFNHQEPDTKRYPIEGIVKRYKKDTGDLSYDEQIAELDPELDKDTIEDLNKEKILAVSQWADTREQAETVQSNKYSSENFYFKGFAEVRYLTNGWTTSGGTDLGFAAGLGDIQARKKICDMALQIVSDCKGGNAWYSQPNRTNDYSKPNKMPDGRTGYDCSSFVSCCYRHAGLTSMTDKSCSGGGLVNEILKNGGEMWVLNEEGLAKAMAGDVLMTATSSVSEGQMGSFIDTNHAMIYMGDGTICHAAGSKKGIVQEEIEGTWRMTKGNHFFMRPADLIAADKNAETLTGSTAVIEEEGTIDNYNYVAKVPGAVCTSYTGDGMGASGLGCIYNETCASHNMPYGTMIYIPALKEQLGGSGILKVTDTGGPLFDFDIFTKSNIGKANHDVYILEWGDRKVAQGYKYFINYYLDRGVWPTYTSAWNKYKEMNGKLMFFLKFNVDDADIQSHPNYNDK